MSGWNRAVQTSENSGIVPYVNASEEARILNQQNVKPRDEQ